MPFLKNAWYAAAWDDLLEQHPSLLQIDAASV
jgi:hypothetical protein